MAVSLTSTSDSISFDALSLGEGEEYDPRTIYHMMMDGTIHSLIRTSPISLLTLVFPSIKRDKYKDLISFLEASRGEEITLVNSEVSPSETWVGYIQNEPSDIEIFARTGCATTDKEEVASFQLQFICRKS